MIATGSNSTTERLTDFIANADFKAALAFYIDNHWQIPVLKRRFYFACIQDGLSGYDAHKRVLKTSIVMLAVNLLIHPLFQLELLDLFAFLSGRYIYYNYFTAWVPVVLNLIFTISLIVQWQLWVIWPRNLFHKAIPRWSRIAFVLVILFLSGTVLSRGIPLTRDIPDVMKGEYATCVYTQEDEYERIKRHIDDVIKGDASARNASLIISSSKLGLRGGYRINIKGDDEKYEMSKLQFEATTYHGRVYPIVIKYLPESKIILQIENK